MDAALARIASSHGTVSIAALAAGTGVTRRHLERLFQDEVGLRLKQVARITRIQSVLAVLRARPSDSGAEIAARFGYSDQAHLIHECRALTGRTPARLTSTERSLAALMRKGPPARP